MDKDDSHVIYQNIHRPFVGTFVDGIVAVLEQIPEAKTKAAEDERKRIYGRKKEDN